MEFEILDEPQAQPRPVQPNMPRHLMSPRPRLANSRDQAVPIPEQEDG